MRATTSLLGLVFVWIVPILTIPIHHGNDLDLTATETCNPNYRVDCLLGFQDLCEAAGCCWNPATNEYGNTVEGIPWCFYKWEQALGYQVVSSSQTDFGYTASLNLVQGTAVYGTDITPLQFDVFYETDTRVHIRISDPNNQRWVPPHVVKTPDGTQKASNPQYSVQWTNNPFGFSVIRNSNNEVLFNSTPTTGGNYNGLVFENQYLEISTSLSSDSNLYGIGEHIRPIRLTPDTYTLWNLDEGTPEYKNLYGSHPFYMELRGNSDYTHGVFLFNSNGMDIVLQNTSLTYKIIGGIFDLYFFMGPNPEDVVMQYTEVIGRPYFIPYWSLGFHQCRWGYNTLDEVKEVVKEYQASDIPLEVMWNDIDYMDAYKDFTYDPVRYPPSEVNDFVNQLHANHQYYVLITDPGIHNEDGYKPWDQGNQQDIWIKTAEDTTFFGKVWPGITAFPDFLNPESFSYWQDMIQDFHDVAPFDGLWIDMNEISNFCSGYCILEDNEVKITEENLDKRSSDSDDFYPNHPPYAIQNGGHDEALDYRTVSADAKHYDNTIEYNTHNLYSLYESWATQLALENIRGKRAFVITRSTFSSSGYHVGHWTGDTNSLWSDMYLTIPDMLNFNIFGIPMIGGDICGFNLNTTEELCARWIELGAFYPFSRDHNAIGQTPQELYVWPLVANISRQVLNIRYSIVPYYYTLFYKAHVGTGGTVVRPLFFEFSSDPNTYSIDTQFLIGSGIMITPVLTKGATTVQAYFPKGVWYDWYTLTALPSSDPQYLTLDAPIDKINIHISGDTIIPTQTPAYTLYESRQNPFQLIVALNESGLASGCLFLDDGDSLNTTEAGLFTLIDYFAQYSNGNGKIGSVIQNDGYSSASSLILSQVTVLGVPVAPTTALNGNTPVTFVYNSGADTVTFQNVGIAMNQEFSITWSS